MLAVSDTSPLLNLAIIDQLLLLRQQHPAVLIPPAVHDELQVDQPWPGCDRLRDALADGWVRVVELANPQLGRALAEQVDRGEAEAMALALDQQAAWLLLDERDGRALAAQLGLRVIGVVGILLRARAAGTLSAVAPVLDALEAEADFRLGSALRQAVLVEAGEL